MAILMAVLVFSTLAVGFSTNGNSSADATKPAKPPKKSTHPWEARQEAAKLRSAEVVPLIKELLPETPSQRRARLGDKVPQIEDIEFSYFLLNNPILEKEEDLYGPVRFMHKKHAGMLNDCFVCHHHRSADLQAPEITRCSACHQTSFNPEVPERIGLLGAHHRQCMGCHKKWNKGPVGCTGCHPKNVPSHKELVKLTANPSPTDVTKECLRCHDVQGDEMLTSTHWLWKGPSEFTEGSEKRVDMGKATVTINNFLVHLASNWPQCTSCHAGYGWKEADFDFTDKTKIDCLICHDTTNSYKKAPLGAGMPDPDVDLFDVARNVGKPNRKTCGECHFAGGPGEPIKHGKLNPFLDFHSTSCDVHMGGLDLQCHDCHKTRNHKISGRSLALPVAEGSRTCEDCHTPVPHQGKALLNHHLNRHSEHISCTTCHNPVYAKCGPVKTFWDWSTAGDKSRRPKKDEHGNPDYMWETGEQIWQEKIKPVYAWYNGKAKRHVLGDKVNNEGVTILTEPTGDIKDPNSKIYPFKVMGGRQAADAKHNYLLVPHLAGPDGYWETLDWEKTFSLGMDAAKLPYSGQYKWVDTVMYLSLNHEVLPKQFALSCVQCHPSLRTERSCGQCHMDKRGLNFKNLAFSNIDFKFLHTREPDTQKRVQSTDYIDFKQLGYKGDPITFGGRFKQLPLGWHSVSAEKNE